MLALSVRQPWCFAILNAGKRLENRQWDTPQCAHLRAFRGRVLIHAAKGCTAREFGDAAAFIYEASGVEVPLLADMPRGAIVGAMTVTDWVTRSSSPWFMGPGALVLDDVKPSPKIVPCVGMLGFFRVPDDVAAELRGGV